MQLNLIDQGGRAVTIDFVDITEVATAGESRVSDVCEEAHRDLAAGDLRDPHGYRTALAPSPTCG